ncbi:hypothetical protein PHISCL_01308 [Aspergillus sclerotialis]|uniref:Uncharacterized protein n=1 Tax=Aspergillus sclerotialis TaxID=2070753 RepID=A0A3A3A8P5_9EURO|nr:hypothetical protein PHISCL_01308 [Aspergillus sclerotialis]
MDISVNAEQPSETTYFRQASKSTSFHPCSSRTRLLPGACTRLRPPGPDCDRAWTLPCTIYGSWTTGKSDHEKPSNMPRRPIKRILAKAQYVREQQQRQQQENQLATLPLDPHNGASSGTNPAEGLGNLTSDRSAFSPSGGVPVLGTGFQRNSGHLLLHCRYSTLG